MILPSILRSTEYLHLKRKFAAMSREDTELALVVRVNVNNVVWLLCLKSSVYGIVLFLAQIEMEEVFLY